LGFCWVRVRVWSRVRVGVRVRVRVPKGFASAGALRH
jgi:hypothetical protein